MAAGDLINSVTASMGAQYEWLGVLFGTASVYVVESVEGLDSMPDLASDDQARTDDHGVIPGVDLMGGRTIDMKCKAGEPNHPAAMVNVRTLARVMRPLGVEVPFAYQRPGEVKKQVLAKPRRRQLPSNYELAHGLVDATLQWFASDPRIYSLVEHQVVIDLAAGEGSDSVAITNSGDFRTYARFEIDGQGSDPRIAVSDQAPDPADGLNFNDRTIALNLDMVAADVVNIDTRLRDIQLNGANAYQTRRNDNQWWEVMPGQQTVTFSRSTVVGTQRLNIFWRDAWL